MKKLAGPHRARMNTESHERLDSYYLPQGMVVHAATSYTSYKELWQMKLKLDEVGPHIHHAHTGDAPSAADSYCVHTAML